MLEAAVQEGKKVQLGGEYKLLDAAEGSSC